MICLIMYVWALLSTHSERSLKPISLHKHIHPNFSFSQFLFVVLTLAMSMVIDYSFLPFLFGASVFQMEIKRSRNTFRIYNKTPDIRGFTSDFLKYSGQH